MRKYCTLGLPCFACGSLASYAIGVKPYCSDCYKELTKGVIPMVHAELYSCGCGGSDSGPSPSQENAVRCLEDG